MPARIFIVAGRQGAGKTTAAQAIAEAAAPARVTCLEMSDALKDAVSVVFGFDRARLRNQTTEDRAYIERPSQFWETTTGIAGFSPRVALQRVGAALREAVGAAVFTAGVVARVEQHLDNGAGVVVVSGVRYTDEAEALLGFAASRPDVASATLLYVVRPSLPALAPDAPECERAVERVGALAAATVLLNDAEDAAAFRGRCRALVAA